MKEAVIVSAVRTAVGKAPKGNFEEIRVRMISARRRSRGAVERVDGFGRLSDR